MVLSYAVHKVADNGTSDLVDTVVVISVFREISFYLVVNNDILCNVNSIACFVLNFNILTDSPDLSVLDCGKRIGNN